MRPALRPRSGSATSPPRRAAAHWTVSLPEGASPVAALPTALRSAGDLVMAVLASLDLPVQTRTEDGSGALRWIKRGPVDTDHL